MRLIEWEVPEDGYEEQIIIPIQILAGRMAISHNVAKFLWRDED